MNSVGDDLVTELRRALAAASEAHRELMAWMSGDAAVIVTDADHRELAARERRQRQLLDELLALAPAAPAPGWPGAWRLFPDGIPRGRGGHRDANAWPTRDAAEAELQQRRDHARSRGSGAWEDASVVWAAADQGRKIPFDQAFWSRDGSGHLIH